MKKCLTFWICSELDFIFYILIFFMLFIYFFYNQTHFHTVSIIQYFYTYEETL
jgi:hypothetical protein